MADHPVAAAGGHPGDGLGLGQRNATVAVRSPRQRGPGATRVGRAQPVWLDRARHRAGALQLQQHADAPLVERGRQGASGGVPQLDYLHERVDRLPVLRHGQRALLGEDPPQR